MVGLVLVGVAAVTGAVSVFWTPYPYAAEDVGIPFSGLGLKHLLGVDDLGRDILSRLMVGTRVSLEVGLGTLVVVILIGVPYGLVAGYFGGKLDLLLSAVLNFFYGIPSILIAIVAGLVLGRGVLLLTGAIALSQWMPMAILVRGQVMTVRQREYVLAAIVAGTPLRRILLRHIVLNIWGPLIVQASYILPQAILTEAFLSFLGFGVPPPLPSWGSMAAEGYQSLQLAPHIAVVPSIALCVLLVGLYFVGDWLRDALDPRATSRRAT